MKKGKSAVKLKFVGQYISRTVSKWQVRITQFPVGLHPLGFRVPNGSGIFTVYDQIKIDGFSDNLITKHL